MQKYQVNMVKKNCYVRILKYDDKGVQISLLLLMVLLLV